MQNSFITKSLSVLALLSISIPGVIARDYNNSSSHTVVRTNNNGRVTVVKQHSNNGRARGHYKNNNRYRANNNHNHNYNRNRNRDRDRRIVINTNNNSNWNWDRHNWTEQRQYMRDNWSARRARMNAIQQQQMDAQLRAQYLAYRGNNFNGQTNWNNYNDPMFLDYVHNRNPSLLTNLRSALGF